MNSRALLLCALLALAGMQVKAAWWTLPSMPAPLGETSAGLVSKAGQLVLVVVGEGNADTYLYNTATKQWSWGAQRPFAGNHAAAEVIGNKLYLFGGLKSGGNKVQIYDITRDRWTLGRDLPYAVGSASTALIGGKVYLCGGITAIDNDTTDMCIVYDVARNTWKGGIASMPLGVNHAASAGDGRLMYIVGGRDGQNRPSAGFSNLQIYDPATNTWYQGAPLPEGRGGTGKAVFYNGELFVFGGETSKSGPNHAVGLTSSKVYTRVDIYNVASNKWRKGTPMPLPRHGIFPVGDGRGNIYVAGGGIHSGNSQSASHTLFRP